MSPAAALKIVNVGVVAVALPVIALAPLRHWNVGDGMPLAPTVKLACCPTVTTKLVG